MPTYPTPERISLLLSLAVGDARITASDRADTVVHVRPSNASDDRDVRAAEGTKIELTGAGLAVKGPRPSGFGFGKVGMIDVSIELPSMSAVQVEASVASLRSQGELGDCRVTMSTGDIHLATTGPLEVTTGAGTITVDHVVGDADITTGSGRLRLGSVDGRADIKNANGGTWVGVVGGALRVRAANGDIAVDEAETDVSAATANGDVRVGTLARGSASLQTSSGDIDFGISSGTAARLDVHTSFGRVLNQLETTDRPRSTDDTVGVRARTGSGDIVVRRS